MSNRELDELLQIYTAYHRLDSKGAWTWVKFQPWQHSCLAPIVYRGTVGDAQLADAEKIHRLLRPFRRRSPLPYITFYTKPSQLRPSRRQLNLSTDDWKIESDYTLEIWTKPVRYQLDARFTLIEGSFRDRKLAAEFNQFQKKENHWDRPFVQDWNRLTRAIQSRSRLTLIRNQSGKTVAAGLVIMGEHGAVLMAGTVSKRYRKRGLWRALLGARQTIAAQSGARRSLLFTKNPILTQRGDKTYRVHTLRKIPAQRPR